MFDGRSLQARAVAHARYKKWGFSHIFAQKSQIGPHPGQRVMQRAAGVLGVCTGMAWVQTDGLMESEVGVEGVFPVGSTEL